MADVYVSRFSYYSEISVCFMSTRKQPIKSMHMFRLKKSDNRLIYAFCTNLQMVLLAEPFVLSYAN